MCDLNLIQECKPRKYNVNKQDGDGCAVGNLSLAGHAAVLLAASKPSQVMQLPCLQPSGQAG